MRAYQEGDYFGSHVCLDFEVTNNQFGNPSYDNHLVCAVWYFSGTDKWYYADKDYKLLLEHLFTAKILIAHNCKYELKWLQKIGAFLDGIEVFDPMLAQVCLDGVQRHPVNLDAMCTRYGLTNKDPVIDSLMKSGVCPSDMPRSLLRARCTRDVETTLQLYHILSNKLLDAGLFPMYHTKAELCKVLADMELQGMCLDADRVRDAYLERVRNFEEVKEELDQFTGGINHNSPKQKQEYLYDTLGFKELKDARGKPKRTSSGGRKTDSATIAALKPSNKEQEKYLELLGKYAKLNAELTKALEKFQACVDSNELLYADFNQHVTQTQRLSSSGTKHRVQLQNLQRSFKPLFKSKKEEWKIMEADYASLEFVVAGYLCRDKQVYEDFTHDVDVHKVTASKIFNIPQEKVTSEQRTAAKSRTFLPLFGGQSGTEDEKRYYKAFNEKYKGVVAKQEDWKASVINHGEFSLDNGITIRFPEAKVNRYGYLNVNNKVCNYPIQHFSTGEMVPAAVALLSSALKRARLQAYMVCTVHDSVVLEYPPEEEEELTKVVVDTLTHGLFDYMYDNYGIKFDFPLGVGVKCGDHWGEGDEVKYKEYSRWACDL